MSVRLETTKGADVVNLVTQHDVLNQIERVKTIQNRTKPSELYTRTWESLNRSTFQHGDKTNSFTAMQFNLLAEGLSAGPSVPTPFPSGIPEGNNYGGFSKVSNPEISLDFSLRKWRLLEVILNHSPDVLALEEIDHFYDFFEPLLSKFGYQGIFQPKPDSPCVRLGWFSDGCALFWKTSVFQKVYCEAQQYSVGNQVYILVTLRHLSTNRDIQVAVTHLKAKTGDKNDEIRGQQVEQLIRVFQESSSTSCENMKEYGFPILVLGDFNTEPDNKCIRHLMKSIGLISSYTRNCGDESSDKSVHGYTTFKIRDEKTTKRVIDYIFYNNLLHCTHILSIPKEFEIDDEKLPGFRFPSDHFNIASRFEIC